MRTIQFKVGVFVVAMALLFAGFLVYLLYAKDFFESEQNLYLTASDAEDIEVGMPLVYSGINIGTVRRVGLTEKGKIQVKVAIPTTQSKWLHHDSIFWLDRPMLGTAKIRAVSPFATSPPLPPDASRPLYGVEEKKDTTQLLDKVDSVLENVENLTKKDGKLAAILTHLATISARMAGDHGVLGGVMGSPEKAERVIALLEDVRALVRRHDELAKRLNRLTRTADQKLFAEGQVSDQLAGALADTRKTLQQTGDSLKKLDAILSDVKDSSSDLPRLRDEVESTLHKTQTLINELNETWPFAKPKELVLP